MENGGGFFLEGGLGGFRNLSLLCNHFIKSFEAQRSPKKMLDYFRICCSFDKILWEPLVKWFKTKTLASLQNTSTKTINKKAYMDLIFLYVLIMRSMIKDNKN